MKSGDKVQDLYFPSPSERAGGSGAAAAAGHTKILYRSQPLAVS